MCEVSGMLVCAVCIARKLCACVCVHVYGVTYYSACVCAQALYWRGLK